MYSSIDNVGQELASLLPPNINHPIIYLDPIHLLRAERALQVEALHHDAHVADDVAKDRRTDKHPEHAEAPLKCGRDDYVPIPDCRHRREGPVDRCHVPSGEGCLEE